MKDTVITLVVNDRTRQKLDQVLASMNSDSYQDTIKKMIIEYEKQSQTISALYRYTSELDAQIRRLKEEVRTLRSR